jgi:hypothetical protein
VELELVVWVAVWVVELELVVCVEVEVVELELEDTALAPSRAVR